MKIQFLFSHRRAARKSAKMLLKNVHLYDSCHSSIQRVIQLKQNLTRAFCLNLNKIYTFQSNDYIDRPWFKK